MRAEGISAGLQNKRLLLEMLGTREVGTGCAFSWWDEDGKAAGLVGACPGWELRGSGLMW